VCVCVCVGGVRDETMSVTQHVPLALLFYVWEEKKCNYRVSPWGLVSTNQSAGKPHDSGLLSRLSGQEEREDERLSSSTRKTVGEATHEHECITLISVSRHELLNQNLNGNLIRPLIFTLKKQSLPVLFHIF